MLEKQPYVQLVKKGDEINLTITVSNDVDFLNPLIFIYCKTSLSLNTNDSNLHRY